MACKTVKQANIRPTLVPLSSQTLVVDHRLGPDHTAGATAATHWPPPALQSLQLSTYLPPGLHTARPDCPEALAALVAGIPIVACWYKVNQLGGYGGPWRPLRLQQARPDLCSLFKPYRWNTRNNRKRRESYGVSISFHSPSLPSQRRNATL